MRLGVRGLQLYLDVCGRVLVIVMVFNAKDCTRREYSSCSKFCRSIDVIFSHGILTLLKRKPSCLETPFTE